MGTIFEELVRRFNEENNEEAGEHWTPRDAVTLMAKLVFLPVADQIDSGTYLVYDGALLASAPASSRQRNRNIAAQARLGKRKWHTESGYSKRSKVETTFHRYKAIVGSAMRARGLAAQRVEARIGCKILNTMTALRMPDSEMIG